MSDQDWIVIGKIVAPQGLEGEVRVYPDSDFPERFLEPGQRWLLRPGATEPQPVELLEGRDVPGRGIFVVQLAGIETREAAEALRDAQLLVSSRDRPHLAEDEYHVSDLLGLEVFHQATQEAIGVVVDVMAAGNDLLEVRLHKQPEPKPKPETTPPNRKSKIRKPKRITAPKPVTVLIPFVKEIVPVVDLENRRIEVLPPPGLLNADEASEIQETEPTEEKL